MGFFTTADKLMLHERRINLMLDLEVTTTMGGDTALEKQPSPVREAPVKNSRAASNGKKGYPSRPSRAEEMTMKLISREALKEKLDKGEGVKLVFALGDWQYRAKHIPGSRHFHDLVETLKGLDQDDEIVVYCSNEACSASRFAYLILLDHGYKNVRRYAGGLLDWEDAGYPLEGEGLPSA